MVAGIGCAGVGKSKIQGGCGDGLLYYVQSTKTVRYHFLSGSQSILESGSQENYGQRCTKLG